MIEYISLVFFVFVIVAVLLLALRVAKGMEQKPRRLIAHVRGEWGEETELDMRLPYKRFMELYPYSKITYEEYKQLQRNRAFKKAVSSQENKRMVR